MASVSNSGGRPGPFRLGSEGASNIDPFVTRLFNNQPVGPRIGGIRTLSGRRLAEILVESRAPNEPDLIMGPGTMIKSFSIFVYGIGRRADSENG